MRFQRVPGRSLVIFSLLVLIILVCHISKAMSQEAKNFFGDDRNKLLSQIAFWFEPRDVPDTNSIYVFYVETKEGKDQIGFGNSSVDKKADNVNDIVKAAGGKEATLKTTAIIKEYDHIQALDFVFDHIDRTHLIGLQLQGDLSYRMEVYQLKGK